MWHSQVDDYEGHCLQGCDNHNSSQQFIGVSEATVSINDNAIHGRATHTKGVVAYTLEPKVSAENRIQPNCYF
jgi:hypothetical protein